MRYTNKINLGLDIVRFLWPYRSRVTKEEYFIKAVDNDGHVVCLYTHPHTYSFNANKPGMLQLYARAIQECCGYEIDTKEIKQHGSSESDLYYYSDFKDMSYVKKGTHLDFSRTIL